MRIRTDERRNAIVATAAQIFAQVGYERASMAMIAERTGGSKTTLYGYFPSKEELFWAAMTGPMPEQGEKALALLDASNPDISSVLRHFGQAYLDIFASRAAIAVTRTAVAEGAQNKELSALLYQRGPKRVLNALAQYFERLKHSGAISDIDHERAAIHFKGLLEAGVIEPLLFGAKPERKRTEAVDAAVGAFSLAYDISGSDPKLQRATLALA
jgi:AcrR family transcriptional regulator